MAYNDDAVLARLSALNDSHDSIATAAQWIMFHRRHADRTVQLWVQRLKDSSSSKRLSLVYLANEVAQQSRIRHKEDFIIAFSPAIAEATAIAYKGASAEIQAKLRRVIDVWKERSIFEPAIQAAIENRLSELDKTRGTTKTGFGSSPFTANSVPEQFAKLIPAYQKIEKLSVPLKSTIDSANQEYDKQTDPTANVPSAPVYAARLNGLLKTLANAESAVAECVKARESLISELEKMLSEEKAAASADKANHEQLSKRKTEIEDKKQEVELAIMQALGPSDGNGATTDGQGGSPPQEPDRPEMEALTPPGFPVSPIEPPTADYPVDDGAAEATESSDGFSRGDAHSVDVSSNGSKKRRRIDSNDDFPDLGADDGLDADVADMLK